MHSLNHPYWIQFMVDPFKKRYIGDVFRVERSLGSGSFGDVYLVRDSRDQKERALKKIEYDEDSENERRLLKILRHENVIEFVEHYFIVPMQSNEITDMCIITEFCEVCFFPGLA